MKGLSLNDWFNHKSPYKRLAGGHTGKGVMLLALNIEEGSMRKRI